MRIAWVCPYPEGALSYFQGKVPVLHPAPWLTAQAPLLAINPEIELHIINFGKHYQVDQQFEEDNIHFHFLKVPSVPRVALLYQVDRFRALQVIHQIQPDLVHGFGSESSYGYIAASSGYPSLIMIQGVLRRMVHALGFGTLVYHPELMIPLWFEDMTVRRGRHFVCETQFAATFVSERNPSAKIFHIKTPVRSEFFAVKKNSSLDFQPNLLFVGSIIPAKGIEILLRAFGQVVRSIANAKLHVIGTGQSEYIQHTLMSLINREGISQQVVFYGYQTAVEVAALMSRVSVLVLPTFMDTSPNVIAEALVAGVPVIASDVGGIPEMLEGGSLGTLVEPGSVGALADAILSVLKNPNRTVEQVTQAREKARQEYGLETQAVKLINVYKEIVSGNRTV
jgi:glycosyltransferase involved in cell wall biosynthesis